MLWNGTSDFIWSIKKLDRVWAASILFLNAFADSLLIKVSGSSPSGNKRNLITSPDFIDGNEVFKAFQAASLPALSPSKQKIIVSAERERICKWAGVVAVPRVATTFVTPCWWRAITSI